MPDNDFFQTILNSTRAQRDVFFGEKSLLMSVEPYRAAFIETYSKIESSFINFVTQHRDLIIKTHQLKCSTSLLQLNMDLTDESIININYTRLGKPHLPYDLVKISLDSDIHLNIHNSTLSVMLSEYGRYEVFKEIDELISLFDKSLLKEKRL